MIGEVLYVKIFKNKKMYVGVTNNFERRMKQHNDNAYLKNSKLLIYRAMRKYSHATEIWASGIYDRELIYMLEKQTIKQLKDYGIGVYNLTNGGVWGLVLTDNSIRKYKKPCDADITDEGYIKHRNTSMCRSMEQIYEVFSINTKDKMKKFRKHMFEVITRPSGVKYARFTGDVDYFRKCKYWKEFNKKYKNHK